MCLWGEEGVFAPNLAPRGRKFSPRGAMFGAGEVASPSRPAGHVNTWPKFRDDRSTGWPRAAVYGRKPTVGRLNLLERADRKLTAGDDQIMKRRRAARRHRGLGQPRLGSGSSAGKMPADPPLPSALGKTPDLLRGAGLRAARTANPPKRGERG